VIAILFILTLRSFLFNNLSDRENE
jgi:hypothetical protein